jgi:hypothetical protein
MEVVVVDNGSSRSNYSALTAEMPSDVTVIRSERNLGFAAGNNLGLRWESEFRPEFALLINNDVMMRVRHTAEALVAALQADTDRVASCPLVDDRTRGAPPETTHQVWRIPTLKECLVGYSWWLSRLPGLQEIASKFRYADLSPLPLGTVVDVETVNGSCFAIRMDFARDIGFLDEGTFLMFEEIILGYQIRRSGKKACIVTSTVVEHLQGSTTGHTAYRFRPHIYGEVVKSQVHYVRAYLGHSMPGVALLVSTRAIDFVGKMIQQAWRDIESVLPRGRPRD